MIDNLTELQIKLLSMFEWFDNLCRENDICYYALGGTMLGAARHQGFIPWDDDIDVGLPRTDYEKLKQLTSNVDGKYIFEFPETKDERFATPYAKLYDTSTTLIERYYKTYKRGIFIDIFPLDGMGDSEKESRKRFSKLKKKYNFFMTRVAALSDRRSKVKNFSIIISRLIPYFLLKNSNLRKSMDIDAKKVNFENSQYGGNVFGNWGFKEIMPSNIMGRPTKYSFNGLIIFGPEKYDEYLTRLYGDWRQLPPLEKQITHHDYILLDLNSSCIDAIGDLIR